MTLTNGIIAHKLLYNPLTRGATVVNTQEPSVPENVKIWSELMQKIKADIHTPTMRGMNGTKIFPHPGVPLEVIDAAKHQIQDQFSRTYYGPSGDAESLVIQHNHTTGTSQCDGLCVRACEFECKGKHSIRMWLRLAMV